MDGHKDFYRAAKWQRERNVSIGGQTKLVQLVTPIACCHYVGQLPYIELSSPICALTINSSFHNNFGRVKISCTIYGDIYSTGAGTGLNNAFSSVHVQGCWSGITGRVRAFQTVILLIISFMTAIQVRPINTVLLFQINPPHLNILEVSSLLCRFVAGDLPCVCLHDQT